ncbi:transcriptional regulator [Prauserella marina]|uniref:Predicted DNA-binding transcriptional regulator YafY, contains an HTH and WYL domains n=1 Tax=Prauserella marina TaxID=530584 RepID=A0A222VWZ6_9PSEU|nr:WYL domain-containing protein [Prauserella marina]ASR38437.1 transcriptional regulator [Prauserella marina]PWV78325.1 putative DNA-binding transcriptional regulator YafY [Prauserella marina]SDC83454.1 Predicted DNA-binding transcriptional regulator YafY, contains an HTH and WYL domains [Prauserella marina]
MRAERLVALLFTLQSRRNATVPELATALGVSERTMHRDIAALQASGVPLWTEQGRHGGVRLVEGWRSRLDGLTSREAVAIFAMGVPRALAELGLGTAVSAAHAKLAATLPAPLREQAQHLAQRFHLDAPGWFRGEDDTEHLAAVATAVWEQRRTRIGYRRGGDVVERDADPLGLVLKAGVWYLVAKVGADIRTYRASRIVGTTDLGERFERPADFDLASWWQTSSVQFERSLRTQRVRLRLSAAGVRALPAILDTDQAREALEQAGKPGDEWTEIELEMEDIPIAVSQLLGLGAEVEVLAPPAARSAFAEAARRMAELHR